MLQRLMPRIIFMIILFIFAPLLFGDEEALKIGDIVLIRKPKTCCYLSPDAKDREGPEFVHLCSPVIKMNKERVCVRSEVWFDRNDVVPLSNAVAYYTFELAKNKNDSNTLMSRGFAHYKHGNHALAINDLSAAIEICPNDFNLYSLRSKIYFEKRAFAESLLDVEKLIKIDPENDGAFARRAVILMITKKFDLALSSANEAIRLDSSIGPYYKNRGLIYYFQKKYDLFLADSEKFVHLSPNDEEAFKFRGFAWLLTKNFDKTIADCNISLRLAPELSHLKGQTYCLRSYAFAATKQYRKALEDSEEAVRLNPQFFWTFNWRAHLLATCPSENIRNGTRAIHSATCACELTQWKSSECISNLAAAHAETGGFAEAVKWQEKAIEIAETTKQEIDMELAKSCLDLYKKNQPYRDDSTKLNLSWYSITLVGN